MIAERIEEFPNERELIEIYYPRWLETIGDPIPGMAELAERLARRGMPLYGITNFGSEFWDMFRPTAPIFDHFRNIIVSGKEALMKPDPAIYRLAEERFGIDPQATLFVDDRAENVEAAQARGWHTHLFDGREGLEERLAEFGISSARR